MAPARVGPSEFTPRFLIYVDAEGREFQYATVDHPGSSGLVAHFSAFFGKWGDARNYRASFQGYFHRLRMLGSCPRHDWLFLCDAFGAHGNGTYYTGEHGDLFVERAMNEIVRREMAARGLSGDDLVTVGSSMGSTGALVVALTLGARGVAAISPHVDLDVAATRCGRYDEVAFACADGDPTSEPSRAVTRRVRALLAEWPPGRPPPRLFVQSMVDDVGVHAEQVLPLIAEWRARGGQVDHDIRPAGGHTSEHATAPLLLDAIDRILAGEAIDPGRYQEGPEFAAVAQRAPVTSRARSRLKLGTRWRALRRRLSRGSVAPPGGRFKT